MTGRCHCRNHRPPPLFRALVVNKASPRGREDTIVYRGAGYRCRRTAVVIVQRKTITIIIIFNASARGKPVSLQGFMIINRSEIFVRKKTQKKNHLIIEYKTSFGNL